MMYRNQNSKRCCCSVVQPERLKVWPSDVVVLNCCTCNMCVSCCDHYVHDTHHETTHWSYIWRPLFRQYGSAITHENCEVTGRTDMKEPRSGVEDDDAWVVCVECGERRESNIQLRSQETATIQARCFYRPLSTYKGDIRLLVFNSRGCFHAESTPPRDREREKERDERESVR